MLTDMDTKCCSKCKETKPATNEFFSIHKSGKYGLHSRCKKCSYEYTKRWLKTGNGKQIQKTYMKSTKGKTSIQKSYDKLGAGVYEITNLITGHNYIGNSTHLYKREKEHFSNTKKNYYSNPKLHEDIKIYSKDAFSFVIIEQLSKDKKTLEAREKYYINKLSPTYNIHNSDKF